VARSQPGDTFVPGHGDVGTAQGVRAFRDYLTTLRTLVSEAQAQGRSGDALVRAVKPLLAHQYGQWDFFNEKVTANIVETDAELRGQKRIPHAAPEQ
jgi:hypothetical protein